MTQWRIQPSGVQAILADVDAASAELGASLTPEAFDSVLDGTTIPTELTMDVPRAVRAVLDDQATNLLNIGNRINAAVVGVSNAVIAYNNGQQDMAGTYQTELVRSAETGDFSYFVEHGHQG